MSDVTVRRSELISLHSATQENANHFNTLNWVMHGVAVSLISALLSGVALQFDIDSFWSLVRTGAGGVVLVFTSRLWSEIYGTHRFMVMEMYVSLHEIEGELANTGPPFELHSRLGRAMNAASKSSPPKISKTHVWIERVQSLSRALGQILCATSWLIALMSLIVPLTK